MSRQRVYQDIPRLAPRILEALQNIPVADAHEAMDRTRVMASSIEPICPGLHLCGQAITCLNYPADNLAIHVGLFLARPGDVLVIAATGGPTFSCWGGMVTVSAKARGISGAVTDGFTRDVAAIRALKFPVWSGGIHAVGAIKHELAGVNVPIVCGGVLVDPGDIIIADDDGVAVVPIDLAEQVLQKALERRNREEEGRKLLANGMSTYEWLGLDSLPHASRAEWNPGTWKLT